MSKQTREPRTSRRPVTGPTGPAWVGGRVVSPFHITEGTPYRPEMILWLELPDLAVVYFKLIGPKEAPVSIDTTLLEAMRSPLIGPSRTPGTVRVASADQAAEVRRVLPGIRIEVGPTPEIHHVLELMAKSDAKVRGREQPSYFEQGRVGAETIEDLFDASKTLYHIAPWKVADDDQTLRVDIPAYGVEGACLSIIGKLGESIGLVLFPSIEGFDRFVALADAPRRRRGSRDLGGSILSLNFEAGSDLPMSMFREVLAHGWPVADAKAYPMVQHRDRDGLLRPLAETDVRVMTSCARSLTAFFVKHRQMFERDVFAPVCESWYDRQDLEVRFTVPYEAGELFAVNDPRPDGGAGHPALPPAPPRHTDPTRPTGPTRSATRPIPKSPAVGRNQPCPCGSGKKYKLCCLRQDEMEVVPSRDLRLPHPTVASSASSPERHRTAGAPAASHVLHPAATSPAASHDLDRKVVDRMDRYARRRFGSTWMTAAAGVFRDRSMPAALIGPWSFHHHLIEGKTIAQWILEDPGVKLQGNERAWLDAQRSAWLSVWEVLDVDPGRSLTLKDLLTEETRVVREVSASEMLGRREALLARVVDHQGLSVLCGVYPRPLPPLDAADVVARARTRLRRKRAVPVDRMREGAIGRHLIACWEDAVEEAEMRSLQPPMLHNTDGDSIVLTIDYFEFNPADRAEIQRRLSTAGGVEDPPDAGGPEPVYVFTKPGNEMHRGWESTIIGRVAIARDPRRAGSSSRQAQSASARAKPHSLRAERDSPRAGGDLLRAESNSLERADSLRHLLEASLGSLITHRTRELTDPGVAMQENAGNPSADAPDGVPTPFSSDEMDRIILEMKAKHYADWADHSLPALGGMTPRAAVKTKSGRERVDLLLKDSEHMEARAPAGQRFDFDTIRRELGLDA